MKIFSHITKVIAYKAFFFSLFLIISFTLKSFGQTFTDSTPAGTETWTVPANVYSLTVQCWGGGGSGGGDSQNGGVGGAGGGAGGSYASSTIAVTPGQTFNYSVGTGGIGSTANGTAGSPTWFDTVTTVYAQGGAPGQSANGGSPNRAGGAGSTAASFGTTLINGGNGNNGTTTIGATGGAGGNGGGSGGAQRTTDGNGNNGVAPGGGGGGAFTAGNTDRSGGNGANGRLRITYTVTIPGDTPCNAISISNDGCSTQDNTGATDSGISAPSGCSATIGYNGNDLWFVTTADDNGALEIYTNHISGSIHNDTVVAFYTGTCGSLTLIDCDDDSGPGLESYQILSGLTPGETVYIREWNYGTSIDEGPFELCLSISSASAPPNDLCSNATSLPCGTNDLIGTTSGASNINSGVSCNMSDYGVWYTFTGDGDLSVITVNPSSGFDAEVSINSGSCGVLSNIACIDSSGSGGLETYSFVTTNNLTYYVYVADPFNGSGPFDVGDFTISRNCQTVSPPPNDDCIGAIDLVVNGSCVTTAATTLYATNSTGVADPSCSGYSGSDVWFTVTVPPSLGNEVTISTQAGVITDSGMAIYSGTCGGSLSEIICSNNSGMDSITLDFTDGISTGDILYVRIWETGNNNNGSFSICATAPIPSNGNVEICLGNQSEPLSTDLFCNTGATSPHPLSGTLSTSDPQANRLQIFAVSTDPCSFATGTPRYYDSINFTVSATGTYVFDISASFDTMGYIVEQGFTPGNCASGTFIAGDDDSGPGLLSQITANLVQGVNYTLITTHYSSFASLGSYSWTVGLTPTSAEWYTGPSGGSPIAFGAFFDPVTAGYISDTNTAGTTSFYVACDGTSSRTQVDFVVNSGPSSVTITGAELDCNNYEITVTVNEPDNNGDGWFIGYTIDGGSPILIDDGNGYLTSSPYTFTINNTSAPAGSLIELSAAINAVTFCETTNFIGSATTSYNCSCVTWDAGGADDNWNTAENWSTDMVPTLSDCVVIPNTGGSDPIVSTTNAQCLSLTINSGAGVTVEGVAAITVAEEVTNSGYFILESFVNSGVQQDTGQLIQIDDTAINTGNITLVRETNVRTQDYVYWSSPVENFSITNIGYSNLRYYWIPTVDTNPGDYGIWQSTSETMVAGKGYIVRAPFSSEPGNNPDTPTWNTQVFTGVPFNGVITRNEIERGNNASDIPQGGGLDIIEAEDDNWNLVGNPYPSALDIVGFLTTNTNLNGYVKLWKHGTRIQQGAQSPFYGNYVYNYSTGPDNYLTYNVTGGVGSPQAPDGAFNGYVGSGQGFFVELLDSASTPFTPTSITFNNSMRRRGSTIGDNGQFFRNSSSENNPNFDIERHRIWLDLVSPNENSITILFGYVEGATLGVDRLFDAPYSDNNEFGIYSISGNENLLIQGRPLPFDINDQVALGITVNEMGIYTLAINNIDGLFEQTTQEIFLNDLETGLIHNLKESPYFFTITEPGEYNNRFIITYSNTTLDIDYIGKHEIRIIAPNNEYIKVTSGTNQIESVKVYDLLGRVLIEKQKINATELTINNVTKANGAYIVKAKLANGMEKIQKVVLK